MSDTAAHALNRILLLIPQVADGEAHAIDDIAERLGVSRKTLLDDVISLGERFDEPSGFVAGLSLEWDDRELSAFTTHFLRPMRLTMRELCALELGLALLRRERTPEEWPAVDRALERLREAITRLPVNDRLEGVQHAEISAAGADHLASIQTAHRLRRKLAIRYRAGASTTSRSRIVCPYSLVFARGMWYMVAFCQTSEALRVFRLDRMESVAQTDETFELAADYSVDEIITGTRLFETERVETLVVRYSPRIAGWIAEREGKHVAPDGSLTLEHPLADEHWAMRHVLQYGPEAEVLAPESVRQQLAEQLRLLEEAFQ